MARNMRLDLPANAQTFLTFDVSHTFAHSHLTMALEVESIEYTIDDILCIHRAWITKLYAEDNKSEVEIVELLYERRLVVT